MKPTPLDIIRKYYPADNDLRRTLVRHSEDVARKALEVARRHPELHLDTDFLYRAAMLHDIGVFLTDAPGIHCHGTEPYLCHGLLGGRIMRREGEPDVARVCERHTGTGLTKEQIERFGLPLPPADYRPETTAEEVVCYADKFFSKSHPERERTVAQTIKSLERFGAEGVARFKEWQERFG